MINKYVDAPASDRLLGRARPSGAQRRRGVIFRTDDCAFRDPSGNMLRFNRPRRQ